MDHTNIYKNSQFIFDKEFRKVQRTHNVVGASLKKPCTPNEIYTFGIMHKSFI